MARNLRRLKQRARKAGIPAIYVNDNFGKWQSDFRRTIEHCGKPTVRGHDVVQLLKPAKEDYFVLKPSSLFGSGNPYPHWDCGKFLRPVYRE